MMNVHQKKNISDALAKIHTLFDYLEKQTEDVQKDAIKNIKTRIEKWQLEIANKNHEPTTSAEVTCTLKSESSDFIKEYCSSDSDVHDDNQETASVEEKYDASVPYGKLTEHEDKYEHSDKQPGVQEKRKRGRPRKISNPDKELVSVSVNVSEYSKSQQDTACVDQPKRKRGRPRKMSASGVNRENKLEETESVHKEPEDNKDTLHAGIERKKRGRPRKHPISETEYELGTDDAPDETQLAFFDDETPPEKSKIGRRQKFPGRPRKTTQDIGEEKARRQEDTGHQCCICGKLLLSSASLNDHMRLHKGEMIECPSCDERFLSRYRYYVHKREAHSAGKKFYHCDKCKYSSLQKSLLDDHYKFKHGPNRERKMCDVCGKTYLGQTALKDHMLVHSDKRFSCDQCDHTTHNPYLLKMHVKNVHSGENKELITCKLCGANLRCKGSYKAHMRRHFGHKPHKCETCGVQFTQKSGLKAHELTHMAPQFTCQECGKKFVTRDKLLRHAVIHTGEKAHKCPKCDYSCNVKHNLKKHCKNVHGLLLPTEKHRVKNILDGSRLDNVESIVIIHEGEDRSEVVKLGNEKLNNSISNTKEGETLTDLKVCVSQIEADDITEKESASASITAGSNNDFIETAAHSDNLPISEASVIHERTIITEESTVIIPSVEDRNFTIPLVVEETEVN